MTETEKAQLNKVSNFLDSIASKMSEQISSIMNGEFMKVEKYAANEIAVNEYILFEDGYRIVYYALDDDENQIGYQPTLPEYPDGFMRSKELSHLALDTDDYDFDNDADMDRMDEYYLQLEKIVTNWFNQCWLKAGGIEASGKHLFSVHDSYDILDLKQQKWIED